MSLLSQLHTLFTTFLPTLIAILCKFRIIYIFFFFFYTFNFMPCVEDTLTPFHWWPCFQTATFIELQTWNSFEWPVLVFKTLYHVRSNIAFLDFITLR